MPHLLDACSLLFTLICRGDDKREGFAMFDWFRVL